MTAERFFKGDASLCVRSVAHCLWHCAAHLSQHQNVSILTTLTSALRTSAHELIEFTIGSGGVVVLTPTPLVLRGSAKLLIVFVAPMPGCSLSPKNKSWNST